MEQLKLYLKWVWKEFSDITTKANRTWITTWVLYLFFGWIGGHLLFLKKYKRALLYLVGWLLILGSWYSRSYIEIAPLVFYAGLGWLCLMLLIDTFYIFFTQSVKLGAKISFLVLLFLFAGQLILFEYFGAFGIAYLLSIMQV